MRIQSVSSEKSNSKCTHKTSSKDLDLQYMADLDCLHLSPQMGHEDPFAQQPERAHKLCLIADSPHVCLRPERATRQNVY